MGLLYLFTVHGSQKCWKIHVSERNTLNQNLCSTLCQATGFHWIERNSVVEKRIMVLREIPARPSDRISMTMQR